MDGWMNGWVNDWMDGWMNEWINEWRNEWMNKWMIFVTRIKILDARFHVRSGGKNTQKNTQQKSKTNQNWCDIQFFNSKLSAQESMSISSCSHRFSWSICVRTRQASDACTYHKCNVVRVGQIWTTTANISQKKHWLNYLGGQTGLPLAMPAFSLTPRIQYDDMASYF